MNYYLERDDSLGVSSLLVGSLEHTDNSFLSSVPDLCWLPSACCIKVTVSAQDIAPGGGTGGREAILPFTHNLEFTTIIS